MCSSGLFFYKHLFQQVLILSDFSLNASTSANVLAKAELQNMGLSYLLLPQTPEKLIKFQRGKKQRSSTVTDTADVCPSNFSPFGLLRTQMGGLQCGPYWRRGPDQTRHGLVTQGFDQLLDWVGPAPTKQMQEDICWG